MTPRLASGEKVIAEEAAREDISSAHRKILAIEMEGYGFSAAVFQSAPQRHHLVMKAICDRADVNKSEDWQPYAAAVAASYAKHFLQRDKPLIPRNTKKSQPEEAGEQQIEELLRRQQRQQEIQREQETFLDNLPSAPEVYDQESRPVNSARMDNRATKNISITSEISTHFENPFAGIGLQIEGLIASLSSALSQERSKELERIRELYREGKVHEAQQQIKALRDDTS